jgi:hypothetical protein
MSPDGDHYPGFIMVTRAASARIPPKIMPPVNPTNIPPKNPSLSFDMVASFGLR